MEHDRLQLEAAIRYLRDNQALRQAVGAAGDAVLQPRYLGVGEHNLNYRFDEPVSGRRYVLRVNVAKQPFHDNQVAYEFAALRALASSGCTPEPVYLDDSPDALGQGVLVESFCAGRLLDYDRLQPSDLECAMQLMADVHAVPVAADCPLFRPRDPLRALFQECLQRFRLYRASVYEDPRITRWVERFAAAAEAGLGEACGPEERVHIVNTEPLPSHFLIPDTRHGAGRGAFIDWERPIIGEVAQDVAYFTAPTTTFWDSDYVLPADRAYELVEDYWKAVDGRFERGSFDGRFRSYRMMTALRSATWCCRALVQYRQDNAHRTEKTARKLPVYLSDDFMDLLARDCFGM